MPKAAGVTSLMPLKWKLSEQSWRLSAMKAVARRTKIRVKKIFRSDISAQVNLISAAPTLQNLRIVLRRRQSGKSKVPAKQRGSWPKVY